MNDTLIFLVLAGIALIFRWLAKQGTSDSDDSTSSPPNEKSPRAPAASDEERVRRFLEALGQPSSAQPPPPVRPRTAPQRRTVTPRPSPKVRRGWAQPLPPLETIPPPLPVFIEVAPPSVSVPLPPITKPVISIPSIVRSAAAVVPSPPKRSSLGAMLRSSRGLREIVMLREILGPPRGLQALTDLRSF